MSRIQNIFSLIILTIFAAPTVLYAQTQQSTSTTETTTSTVQTPGGPVTIEKQVIKTTVPAAKETVAIPTGYVSCSTVPAGWVNAIWIPEHKVCSYSNSPLGTMWVEGYWACINYKIETGECTNWNWVAAHWMRS